MTIKVEKLLDGFKVSLSEGKTLTHRPITLSIPQMRALIDLVETAMRATKFSFEYEA